MSHGDRGRPATRGSGVAGAAATPTALPRRLLRFGYDGSSFAGWARQPGLRTIEGTIRDGLARFGIARTAAESGLEVASRTDRGVSARANLLVLRSDLPSAELLRRMNAIAPELFFQRAASVDERFRVRHAAGRVYRYFEPRRPEDPVRYARAARLFRGSVDAGSFGRGAPVGRPQGVPVASVVARPLGPGYVVEVRARSFVWGMVRKIVGALREVDAGRLSVAELSSAVAGRTRLTLPMAEPEGLVLWEVLHPSVRWDPARPAPNAHQTSRFERSERAAWQRARVLRALSAARLPGPRPAPRGARGRPPVGAPVRERSPPR